MDSMSCLRSGLLAFVKMDVMLNSLDLVPSLMDIIFGVFLVTVKEPFHFPVSSRKTLPFFPGCMRYFVVGGNLDVRHF